MYTIDKNIPMPLFPRNAYPFADMEVGDSIAVLKECAHSAVSAAYSYGRKRGKKFSQRAEGTQVRIWRTA